MIPNINARASDPRTSHEAADRIGEFAPAIEARIVAVLREHGPLAAEQIADMLGDVDRVQIGRRTSDLKRDGVIWVYEAGGHRNRTGRRADVLAA